MKSAIAGLALLFGATTDSFADDIIISHTGSQEPVIASSDHFTGRAWVDAGFKRADPARIGGGIVTFEPSARTAWHTHPLGQTLFVTAGVGLVQEWGKQVHRIKTGDVVFIPPNVKHWHGASRGSGMTHIAVAEALNGQTVAWLEHVDDEQYWQANIEE